MLRYGPKIFVFAHGTVPRKPRLNSSSTTNVKCFTHFAQYFHIFCSQHQQNTKLHHKKEVILHVTLLPSTFIYYTAECFSIKINSEVTEYTSYSLNFLNTACCLSFYNCIFPFPAFIPHSIYSINGHTGLYKLALLCFQISNNEKGFCTSHVKKLHF